MIPKIIHYCWFGGNEKPKKIEKCIETWKQVLTDYEFMEWNETNFDVTKLKYTQDALNARKYAFVSDVARVKALYEYGGIYLDTDVIVHKTFDSILDNACVLGFEQDDYVATSFMACEKHHSLMKEFYELYKDLDFYDKDGSIIQGTNVAKLTKMLEGKGLNRNNEFQMLGDIAIYPQEYFSPYDYGNCVKQNTANTICEHLFFVSWMPMKTRVFKMIKKVLVKIIGRNGIITLRKWFKK